MKAREFIEKSQLKDIVLMVVHEGKETIIELKLSDVMTNYAKLKCKEQRALCASLSSESWSTDEDGQEWVTNNNPSYDDIINAPEPDLS